VRDHAKNKHQKAKETDTKREYASPNPTVFSLTGRNIPEAQSPEALKREATTRSQVNFAEDTIIYGEDDAVPLRLAQAVQESPAASACISTISKFIKGASFSDKDLMKVKINKTGQTLWDLHCVLSNNLALFEGFALNFKYNESYKITNIYVLGFENVRMVKPEDDLATEITHVKYNPYFGTQEFKKEFTKCYPLFDLKLLPDQIADLDTIEKRKAFPGQVYYYGSTKPLYRFYPVPDYWSCKKWIYIDAKIQEFHAENLENGFFQSVLMNVIGDPNALSKNPRLQEEYTDENGVKKKRATKTVGEEFNDSMAANFSGTRKAGNVMVQWSLNDKDKPLVTEFPSNTNADLFNTLQNLTTKNITIGTNVPSILANIHEGVSLGSDGNTIQKSVEIMQSNVKEKQNLLMSLYNDIIIPNLHLEEKVKLTTVEIVQFNPITTKIEIEDKFWEALTPE
jgi:hypothetical protein